MNQSGERPNVSERRADAILSPKETKILAMRKGYLDGFKRTYEEIGKEFGVTRERIRQIEAKAEEKLRLKEQGRKYR